MLLEKLLEKNPNLKSQFAEAARRIFRKMIDDLSDSEVLQIVALLEEKGGKVISKKKDQPLPSSVARALQRTDFSSYKQLANLGKKKIAQIKGIGKIGLKQIVDFLEGQGYEVAP